MDESSTDFATGQSLWEKSAVTFPNFTEIFPAGVDLGFTRCDYEIQNYQDMSHWQHLPEQVNLMLEHEIGDIVATQEF